MFIKNMPPSIGESKPVQANVLANLVAGQRLNAVALNTALATEIIKLKLQKQLFEVITPLAVKEGQNLTLEVIKNEQGKLALKLLDSEQKLSKDEVIVLKQLSLATASAQRETELLKPNNAETSVKLKQQSDVITQSQRDLSAVKVSEQTSVNTANKTTLQIGQQLPVTVIAKPEVQKVVVAPIQANNKANSNQSLPRQIELDISQLKSAINVGDKLQLRVAGLNPLSMQVQVDKQPLIKEQRVVEKLGQLLAKAQPDHASLSKLGSVQKMASLPSTTQQAINHLLQNVIDRGALLEPDKFKQAIQNSGVFLEKTLLQKPEISNRDFKANLQNLLVGLQTEIIKRTTETVSNSEQRSLPQAVTVALKAIHQSPHELAKVPAHIRATLANTGVAPSQLLAHLLATVETGSSFTVFRPVEQDNLAPKLQSNSANRAAAVELTLLRELVREVESKVAKVQLNQLAMVQQDSEQTSLSQLWLFDLPVKDKTRIDMLQVQMQKHKHNPLEQEGDIWEIDLGIDTAELGALRAAISFHEQDVKIVFNAHVEETISLLEQHSSILLEKLTGLGVSVSHMNFSHTEINSDLHDAAFKKIFSNLVDLSV